MRLATCALLIALLSAPAGAQGSDAPQVTSLLTPTERQAAGLNKLSSAELQALNAGLSRVFASLLVASDSPRSISAGRAADELDLFDSEGRAVAYLDPTEELTLYLWAGQPVAYLEGENIYGFNGKHLGWYLNGRVFDHDGKVVAASPRAFSSPVSPAGLKSFKQFKPFKSFKEFAPFRPLLSASWSSVPAHVYFLQGAK